MLLRKLAAGLVFLGGVAVVAAADLPAVRFASVGNSHVCLARQMLDLPSKIDVVFLGSSRIRRGLKPETFVEATGGEYETVYNLGRPSRLILRSESIITHLVETGRAPKVVVLEVDLDEIRFGSPGPRQWNRTEPGHLTYAELLAALPADTESRWHLIVDGIRHKLAISVARHFSGITTRVLLSASDKPAPHVCWRNSFDKDDDRRRRHRAQAEDASRQMFGDGPDATDGRFANERTPKAQVELAVLDRIRQRLDAAGTRLVVIRPMGYADPPLAPAVIDKVTALIPEFRAPPDALARQLSRLVIDKNHFGPEGRGLYTRWLAGVVLAEMETP